MFCISELYLFTSSKKLSPSLVSSLSSGWLLSMPNTFIFSGKSNFVSSKILSSISNSGSSKESSASYLSLVFSFNHLILSS